MIDETEVVSTISGASATVGAVGVAVLGVLAGIMVYRLIRSVMGR